MLLNVFSLQTASLARVCYYRRMTATLFTDVKMQNYQVKDSEIRAELL